MGLIIASIILGVSIGMFIITVCIYKYFYPDMASSTVIYTPSDEEKIILNKGITMYNIYTVPV